MSTVRPNPSPGETRGDAASDNINNIKADSLHSQEERRSQPFDEAQDKRDTPYRDAKIPMNPSGIGFATDADVTMAEVQLTTGPACDDKTINENTVQHQLAHGAGAETISLADNILTRDQDRKYKLRSEIARGGMGLVMEAHDINLHRGVAMKVLLDPHTASKQRILRFIEEARITAQLQHPGIVPIHEIGVDKNGNVFYTMKHVTGRTLKEILKKLKEGKTETVAEYPINRLLNILKRVCDAVAYAHSKGVVHRDLKPDNIMIGDYGEVMVLDWGLAKLMKHHENGNIERTISPDVETTKELRKDIESIRHGSSEIMVTMEGNVIGTPGYMAPEQARGQIGRIDERSDVYSLGAILYHILKLEPTVRCDTTARRQDVLEKIRTNRIEPLKENKRATKSLIAITMKALSLRPKDRYGTVKSFQSDLDAYMGGFLVTAEEESVVKLAKLFVLRHKVVSLFSIIMLGFLITGLSINYMERLRAEKAEKTAINAEENAVAERKRAEKNLSNLKATAPSLLSLVDYYIERHEIQEAKKIVDQATDLVPESPDCHIKRGNLLQVLYRFKEASIEYESALILDPANKTADSNLELCHQMLKSKDVQRLSSILWEQGRFAEASYIILSTVVHQKPEMIKLLFKWMLDRENIRYKNIQVNDNMYRLDLSNSNIADLSPLKSLPLTHLNLTNCKGIYDLRPLKGMSLMTLDLTGTDIADLHTLKGMSLKELILNGCGRIVDITPLKGMPLTRLELGGCPDIVDLRPLKGMPLARLNLSQKGVSSMRSNMDDIARTLDLSPLKGLPLEELDISGCTEINDLSFLKGMPLSRLNLTGCINITDLSPLRGMKMSALELNGCSEIKDYSILRTMPTARFLGR